MCLGGRELMIFLASPPEVTGRGEESSKGDGPQQQFPRTSCALCGSWLGVVRPGEAMALWGIQACHQSPPPPRIQEVSLGEVPPGSSPDSFFPWPTSMCLFYPYHVPGTMLDAWDRSGRNNRDLCFVAFIHGIIWKCQKAAAKQWQIKEEAQLSPPLWKTGNADMDWKY